MLKLWIAAPACTVAYHSAGRGPVGVAVWGGMWPGTGMGGYTWLGAVRSSRADRLVTAMVSAAARAMTVR